MKTEISKSSEVVSLSKELLDDIEMNRLSGEALVLKTMRLARLANAPDKIRSWLSYELTGYDGSDVSLEYMGYMGRWTDYESRMGYLIPLAQIEANIKSFELQLQNLRVPDIHFSRGEKTVYQMDSLVVNAPVQTVLSKSTELQNFIAKLSGIRSRVLANIHSYVVGVYHEKVFSGLSESIFEHYKMAVDAKIAQRTGDVLERMPSIYNRLCEGDPEAVSQALTTCRRIIDYVADAIYPPSDESIVVNGISLEVGVKNTKNRINAYIYARTASKSRQDKFRQTLTNLYDRTSAGVHSDVGLEEAKSIFLQTYLFLGEVFTLEENVIHSELRN